jgi:hypothetical protein
LLQEKDGMCLTTNRSSAVEELLGYFQKNMFAANQREAI